MIGQSLKDLYPNDQSINNYVDSAMQMLGTNNINQGAETLQRILYNNNLNDEMKKNHELIVQSAKTFAEQSYDMLRAGQVPEFMMQIQQQQFEAMAQAQGMGQQMQQAQRH